MSTCYKPILYGMDINPAVRAVLLTAYAIGLDFEFIEIDLHVAEHMTEEYMEKNPEHTVPTLEDDGKYVCHSHAIATYLIEKYAKNDSLYPKDFYQRALVDQRLYFESGVIFPRLVWLVAAIEHHQPTSWKNKALMNEAYGFLETFLTNNRFLVGPTLTVADLCYAATISSAQLLLPISATQHPKLVDWLKRISLMPYYEKANGAGLQKAAEFIESVKL